VSGERDSGAKSVEPSPDAPAGAGPADQATTALMRQYLEVKAQVPDAIVFFRLGDFYEMFYEDAIYASRVLSLTQTTRDKGKENPVPMCGVPHHSRVATSPGSPSWADAWPSASSWKTPSWSRAWSSAAWFASSRRG